MDYHLGEVKCNHAQDNVEQMSSKSIRIILSYTI